MYLSLSSLKEGDDVLYAKVFNSYVIIFSFVVIWTIHLSVQGWLEDVSSQNYE